MIQFYSQYIRRGDLCFDVGANIGARTDVFLALGARVICVEPQSACLQKLHKRFTGNAGVTIVEEAVGDHVGCAEIAICEEARGISTMCGKWITDGRFSKRYRWTRIEQVRVVTLDHLISLYGLPVFCKIDVEGSESSVLKGLTRTIRHISFEFTAEFFGDVKESIDHLLAVGAAEFNCSIGESMELLFPEWVTPQKLYAAVEASHDRFLWGDIYTRFRQTTNAP